MAGCDRWTARIAVTSFEGYPFSAYLIKSNPIPSHPISSQQIRSDHFPPFFFYSHSHSPDNLLDDAHFVLGPVHAAPYEDLEDMSEKRKGLESIMSCAEQFFCLVLALLHMYGMTQVDLLGQVRCN